MEDISSIVNSIRNLFITEDDDDLCVVCYSNLSNITFYPCKHDNCCESCYLQLTPKKCPYCRANITSTDPIVELALNEFPVINPEVRIRNLLNEGMRKIQHLIELNNNPNIRLTEEEQEELYAHYDYLAWSASF